MESSVLTVRQTLTCDACGGEIDVLEQVVVSLGVLQLIDRPQGGVGCWKDVCPDCFEAVSKAFWAVKLTRDE